MNAKWYILSALPVCGLAAVLVLVNPGVERAGDGDAAVDRTADESSALMPSRAAVLRIKAEHFLREAERRSESAVGTSVETVRPVFARARAGAKGYADEVLSWNGKWELVKGGVARAKERLFGETDPEWDPNPDLTNPFARAIAEMREPPPQNPHDKYLADEFTRRVLDPQDVERAIAAAVAAYAAEVEAAENELLVRLRTDVFVDPATPAGLGDQDQDVRRWFSTHLDALGGRQVPLAAGQWAATFGGSWVLGNMAANVATAAAAELGISSAVLGVGGLSSVATLGATVAISFVVEWVINAVIKQFGHDPADKLEAAVVGSLDDLERAVTAALRAEVERAHAERVKARRAVIDQLLADGGAK